jgi:hypothetical protein
MRDIPDFQEAFNQFRRFLADNGHADDVFWVFREDMWQLSPARALIKYPPPSENESLSQKVFAEGRSRGIVEIKAVAATADKVAATVWFPKYPHEEVQGWYGGMRLSILSPLPRASVVAAWRWRLIQFLPKFQHYQREAIFIVTRTCAAA